MKRKGRKERKKEKAGYLETGRWRRLNEGTKEVTRMQTREQGQIRGISRQN